MKRLIVILLVALWSIFPSSVSAFDTGSQNNKFGIHLAQPEEAEIQRAAELVNSSGGKWGYITLVIQENDRDKNKWQNVFNQLRKAHLIPIIRLATRPEGAKWKRPKREDVGEWVNFLDSLLWVVKDRYVILFNEPNHGSEWGGAVDAKNYSEVSLAFAEGLKQRNKDFFVMLAGLDAAAPSAPPAYEDEAVYLRTIFNAEPSLRDIINGLASHSYPNPGFRGTPGETGRNTVRTYEWELEYLKSLEISRDLPVFITEAGWPHGHYSPETVGSYIRSSFENVWLPDSRVRAVTPFILNYQGEPFASFSWIKPGGNDVYPHYTIVQAVPKEEGSPEIVQKGSITFSNPTELLIRSTYHFQFQLKNTGQGHWDKDGDYMLKLDNYDEKRYLFSDISNIKPGDKQIVDLYLKTDAVVGTQNTKVALYKKDKKIIESAMWKFQKLPLPTLNFNLSFFPKIRRPQGMVEIQIFNSSEELVYKKKEVGIANNQGTVDEIANIALGEKYRVVVLRPYYLPRQRYITFKKGKNATTFESLIPLDFNRDGAFSWRDIEEVFKKPGLFWIVLPW